MLALANDALANPKKAEEIRLAIAAMPADEIVRTLVFPLILKVSQRIELSPGDGLTDMISGLCVSVSQLVKQNATPDKD